MSPDITAFSLLFQLHAPLLGISHAQTFSIYPLIWRPRCEFKFMLAWRVGSEKWREEEVETFDRLRN